LSRQIVSEAGRRPTIEVEADGTKRTALNTPRFADTSAYRPTMLALPNLKEIAAVSKVGTAIDLGYEFANPVKPSRAGVAYRAVVYALFCYESWRLATGVHKLDQVRRPSLLPSLGLISTPSTLQLNGELALHLGDRRTDDLQGFFEVWIASGLLVQIRNDVTNSPILPKRPMKTALRGGRKAGPLHGVFEFFDPNEL
jgi:hypothetical protein